MKSYISLFFLLLYCTCIHAQSNDLKTLYAQLDETVAKSETYVSEKESAIAMLRENLKTVATDKDRYDVTLRLFGEYKSYINDSAIVMLNRCRVYAERMNRQDLVGYCYSLAAFQFSTTGLYQEALTTLDRVQKRFLTRDQLVQYYISYNHVYGEMGYYTSARELTEEYYAKSSLYEDSLLNVLDKNSNLYYLYQGRKLYNMKRYKEALQLNDRWMKNVDENSRDFAVVAYYRHLIYNIQGNMELSKYWLTRSAISDIRHAVMDQGSLWALANLLDNDGDLDRAYSYISFSWDCAMKFGTRVRSAQISPILSVIEKNYQEKIKDSNRQLRLNLAFISLMTLLLLGMVVYVNKQRKKLAAARNDLKVINEKLEKLNGELVNANAELDSSNRRLSNANQMLNESNRVKDEYIGRFLSMCSQYVDKLDDYRKMVNRKLKNKEIEELFRLSKSTEYKEKELDELYTNFDSVFLHLFPNFVDDFNAMLKPEVQAHNKDPYRLTTDIRIFALIRLGIDDSCKIAEFLHYSVNTIYNYRARIKNGALVNREEFELRVKKLGLQ